MLVVAAREHHADAIVRPEDRGVHHDAREAAREGPVIPPRRAHLVRRHLVEELSVLQQRRIERRLIRRVVGRVALRFVSAGQEELDGTVRLMDGEPIMRAQ